jgi:hypothetical protein
MEPQHNHFSMESPFTESGIIARASTFFSGLNAWRLHAIRHGTITAL